jgi:predicted phage terminase large subunit-like protein
MPNLTVNEYHAILRRDFCGFIERSFYELNPETEFLPNWHIEVIAEELEACRRGETKRLIINLPPRSLKSHCATVAFPAWLLGHIPSAQIICASYGQDLANKHAIDSRAIMASNFYRSLFSTRLSPQKQAVQEFMTTQKGVRLATSVGGVLTGRGADMIIVDDPLKPEEALSETQRKTTNDWFDHTLYSRLNDKRTGRIIIVTQRLHEDDLVGHVMSQGNWKLVRFPAIAEEEEPYVIHTAYGLRRFHRHVGEALHPERESLETLGKIREALGEYNFSGQYLQTPAPLGGGMVKYGWFKTFTTSDRPSNFELILQSWDTASKPTELADYSVCTTWGVKEKHIYLLHVHRQRLDYPALKRAVGEQAAAFRPTQILIEDKSSGTQLIQELIHEGVHGVQRYEPTMDKIMRLHSVTNIIENGFVYLPEKAEWLPEFVHEMTSFPKAKYDDQTDSTSQALDWIKQHYMGQEFGLSKFYRREAAKLGLPCPVPAIAGDTAEISRRPDQANLPVKSNPPAPGPCPKCRATCIVFASAQLRCNQCGHTWWPNGKAAEVARVTRADVLRGRARWGASMGRIWRQPTSSSSC